MTVMRIEHMETTVRVDDSGLLHVQVKSHVSTQFEAERISITKYSMNPMHIVEAVKLGGYDSLTRVARLRGETLTLRDIPYEQFVELWVLAKRRWAGE